MPQLLLLPDPRPLVERLGADFFRHAPESPGVYLMRGASDAILYIGKAKNLRKRLASYRVANPDRLRRRQLRLLHAVERIELQECPDETSALEREAALLRSIRPRFNRAGTWPGSHRFLGWRLDEQGIHLAISGTSLAGFHGPLNAAALIVRASLLRLLWCAIYPQHGLTGLPQGWFNGHYPAVALIHKRNDDPMVFETAARHLRALFAGEADPLVTWIRHRTESRDHPFEVTVRESDLETIVKFASRHKAGQTD